MNANWEQLRYLLQVVALPVTGQMHLVPDDCCRPEVLAHALSAWRRELPTELTAALTPEQERTLVQLEHQLENTGGEATCRQWTDTAMRRSKGWQQARWLARAALVRFGWLLELPVGESNNGNTVHSRAHRRPARPIA